MVKKPRKGLFVVWSGHQESNLDLRIRSPLYYPLYYGQFVNCYNKYTAYLMLCQLVNIQNGAHYGFL